MGRAGARRPPRVVLGRWRLAGMIRGPRSERQLRWALAGSQGDPTVFLTGPVAAVLVAMALVIPVGPPLYGLLPRCRRVAP